MYINETKFLSTMMKRGLSHIEFVISFVLFIGFVLFAFVFFNPLQSQRTLKSSMDYAWIEVSQETQEKLDTYSVYIFSASGDVALDISDVHNSYNASVEDVDGNIIETYTDASGEVNFNTNGKEFFRIKYSPALLNGNTLSGTPPNQYSISSSTSEKIYFESLLLNLNDTYFLDYEGLKQKINLPNRVDFGFVVKFGDVDVLAVNEIPEGVEVLSRSDRIDVIRNSGKRERAELRVLVW